MASDATRIDLALASRRKAIDAVVPATDALAARYEHALLGRIKVVRSGQQTIFDFGPWSTTIGRKADPHAPGGYAYVSTAPSEIENLVFIPGNEGGRRTLTLSDNQHSYVYREVSR